MNVNNQNSLLNILLSFFLLLINLSSIDAQSLEADPASVIINGEACWDNTLHVNFTLKNTSGDDITFLWSINRIDVPLEWEIQVTDVTTNFNYGQEFCPPDKINFLTIDQQVTYTGFLLRTNNLPSEGKFEWVFFDDSDSTNVYLTIPIEIIATECTSAIHDVDVIDDLNIYPNPTADNFKVSNEDLVDRLSIYNIVGKEVKSMNQSSSGSYNVSDLTNGMYLVRLFDEDGDVLKVVRMSKS